MISQSWIEKRKSLLSITTPGAGRDAIAMEIEEAETSNATARAKHLRTGGHVAGDDVTVCVHCERWARPGKPVVHATRCPERDNREAQPVIGAARLDKAESKQLSLLSRG
jgi:hypothetical protein